MTFGIHSILLVFTCLMKIVSCRSLLNILPADATQPPVSAVSLLSTFQVFGQKQLSDTWNDNSEDEADEGEFNGEVGGRIEGYRQPLPKLRQQTYSPNGRLSKTTSGYRPVLDKLPQRQRIRQLQAWETPSWRTGRMGPYRLASQPVTPAAQPNFQAASRPMENRIAEPVNQGSRASHQPIIPSNEDEVAKGGYALYPWDNRTHPVYRFYSITGQGYLQDENSNTVVTAKYSDPLSLSIEWEWIVLEQYSASLVRHKLTKRYICFNKNGRPTLLWIPSLTQCLLRTSAFANAKNVFRRVLRPRTPSAISAAQPNTLARSRRSINIFSHPTLSRQSNTDPPKQTTTLPAAPSQQQTSRSRADTPPHLVWLESASAPKSWKVRFCANGMPFAYNRPMHRRCRLFELPTSSEALIMCPPVPSICRKTCLDISCSAECRAIIGCQSSQPASRVTIHGDTQWRIGS